LAQRPLPRNPVQPPHPNRPADPGQPADPDEPAALVALGTALFALVGQSLVSIGRAHWHIRWTALPDLRSDSIAVEELAALVDAAVRRPEGVARLRLHLASHGVPLDTPVVLAGDVPGEDTITITTAR